MKLRKGTIDETGKVYGKLVVEYPIRPPNSRKIMWHCKCKCGNEIDCYGSDLRAGKRTSCGNHCNSKIDEVGKTYGFLKVLDIDETPPRTFPDNCVHFICECQLCGTIKSISGRNLRNGATQSCGCSESLGEQLIAKILQELNFNYKKEYMFKDLVGETGANLRFDFYVTCPEIHKNFLIEFQGIQHFREIEYFRDNYETRIKNDQLKLNFCKDKQLNILYFNQISSRRFSGDQEEFKKVIIEYYNKLKEGEKGNEIFNYNY